MNPSKVFIGVLLATNVVLISFCVHMIDTIQKLRAAILIFVEEVDLKKNRNWTLHLRLKNEGFIRSV
jgi:hypothetical protein